MEYFEFLSDKFIIPIITTAVGTGIVNYFFQDPNPTSSSNQKYGIPIVIVLIGIFIGSIAQYMIYDSTLSDQLQQDIMQVQKEMELQHAIILERSKHIEKDTDQRIDMETILKRYDAYQIEFTALVDAYNAGEYSRKETRDKINIIRSNINTLRIKAEGIKMLDQIN